MKLHPLILKNISFIIIISCLSFSPCKAKANENVQLADLSNNAQINSVANIPALGKNLENKLSNLSKEDLIFIRPFLIQVIEEEIQIYENYKKETGKNFNNSNNKSSNNVSDESAKVALEAIFQINQLKPYNRKALSSDIVEIVKVVYGK